MRRLQSLPQRQKVGKKEDVLGAVRRDGGDGALESENSCLKDDLQRMRSELEGLEKEELVHHQSQLQVAQEKLRTKRRSDLAKRMQESQRLQMLRERKAELDETRRTKLVDFKQRMIHAAEKALERESLVYDTLYENIGEALANQEMEDGAYDDDRESVVLGDDGVSFGGAHHDSPAVLGIAGRGAPMTDLSSMGQFRVPSAFEEHLKEEQRRYGAQLFALRHNHSAPRSTAATHPTHDGRFLPPIPHDALQHRKKGNPADWVETPPSATLAPFISSLRAAGDAEGDAAVNSKKALQLQPVQFKSAAQEEHQKVREELKRLIAQGDDDGTTPPITPQHSLRSLQPSNHDAMIQRHPKIPVETLVQQKLARVEASEVLMAQRTEVVNQSIVPFEDALHNGAAILEDAESNFQAKMAVDRAEREKLEKLERQQRSSSLFGGMSTDFDAALPRSRSSVKTRRVSMLVDDDVATGASGDARSGSSAAALSPLGQSVESVVSDVQSASTIQQTPPTQQLNKTEPIPVAIAIVSNPIERQQLLMEQQQARFMARRAVQKEELSLIQRKLQELLREEEEAAAAAMAAASATADRDASAIQRDDTVGNQLPLEMPNKRLPHQVAAESSLHEGEIPDSTERASVVDDAVRDVVAGREVSESSAQESNVAATKIQCMYRCFAARAVARSKQAQYAVFVARLAQLALEEEARHAQAAVDRTKELAAEQSTLAALRQKEAVFEEVAVLRNLERREAALVACSIRAAELQRRTAAAIAIQTAVRGHQVRCWYRAVSLARRALLGAGTSRAASHVQEWWRNVQRKRAAQTRQRARRHLCARYGTRNAPIAPQHRSSVNGALVSRHSNGNIRDAAVTCLQCFVRRLLTRRVCQIRREVACASARHQQASEAATVIQCQWRKHSVNRQGTKQLVSTAVERAAHTASAMVLVPENLDVARADAAATTIAAYARRFLCRDEIQRRWTTNVIDTAIQCVASIRQEEDQMEE